MKGLHDICGTSGFDWYSSMLDTDVRKVSSQCSCWTDERIVLEFPEKGWRGSRSVTFEKD